MEKPLLTAVSWVGQNLRGSPRAGQTVLASLMKSQICHPPASSVTPRGEGSEEGQWPLFTFLSGRKLSPSSYLDDRHVSSARMPLVTFKLLPWFWSTEGMSLSKSMYGFFKRNYLELQKLLLLTQFPLFFAARSYGDVPSGYWKACSGTGIPHS